MSVIHELKKALIKKRGFIIILIFLAISTLFSYYSSDNNYISSDIQNNKEYFHEYLSVLNGKQTESKIKFINDESSKISEAQQQLRSLAETVGTNQISEKEFSEKMSTNIIIINKQTAFNQIMLQNLNASEDPEHRYFIYPDGWSCLLGKESINIMKIALLIIVISSVFCYEYESGISPVLLCSKNGKTKLFLSKLISIVIITILIGVIFELSDIIVYSIKYGLPNGSFPVQSIKKFMNCQYNLSLYELTAITFVNKLMGLLYLAFFIVLMSVLLKKSYPTAFSAFVILFLPYIAMYKSTAKYKVPTPLALLLSTGFFLGNKPETEVSKAVKAISKNQYLSVVAFSILLTLIMMVIAYIVFCNKRIRNTFKIKKTLCFAILLSMLLVFSGCTKKQTICDKSMIYNQYCFNNIILYNNYNIDNSNSNYVIKNLDDNSVSPFLRNPFTDDDTLINRVFAIDGNAFYITHSDFVNYKINKMDLKTYHIQTLYNQNKIIYSDFDFANINKQAVENKEYDIIIESDIILDFFLSEDCLFLNYPSYVEMYNLNTKKTDRIIDEPTNNLAYYNDYVYYLTQSYEMYRINIKTLEKTKVSDDKAFSFVLTPKGIIYSNLSDSAKMYLMDYDSLKGKKISDTVYQGIAFDDDYIFYLDKDNYLYHITYDGTDNKRVIDEKVATFNTNNTTDYIAYYPSEDIVTDQSENDITKQQDTQSDTVDGISENTQKPLILKIIKK